MKITFEFREINDKQTFGLGVEESNKEPTPTLADMVGLYSCWNAYRDYLAEYFILPGIMEVEKCSKEEALRQLQEASKHVHITETLELTEIDDGTEYVRKISDKK